MNVKTTSKDPNDSQVIKPRRVYHCKNENRMLMRDEAWKDHGGKYHCGYCSSLIDDVTLTTTGNDFMALMGI